MHTKPRTRRYFRGAPADRFVNYVDFRNDDECWNWNGGGYPSGYGRFTGSGGQNVYAHRFAHELWTGPIPAGLTIDHLCRNRACVNPRHLEAVTMLENIRRIPREVRVAAHAKRKPSDKTIAARARAAERHAARARRAATRDAQMQVENSLNLPGIFRQKNGKWTARGKANGARHIIGTFTTPDEAHAAYVAWKATP